MEKEELLPYYDRDSAFLDLKAAVREGSKFSLPFKEHTSSPCRGAWTKFGLPLVTLLIGIIIGMLGSTALNPTGYKHWTTSYSPAIPHISFKPERDQKPKSPEMDPMFLYSGPFTKTQENAWTDLLFPVTMPLTKDQMEQAGENPDTRVQLADRQNYPATLGIFHELHCLRKIRRFIHQDFWYANSTAEVIAYEKSHADHCLHTVHKSLMCYADVGINTFEFRKGIEKPATMSNAQRMCIDWEKFHKWATEVSVGFAPPVYRPPGA